MVLPERFGYLDALSHFGCEFERSHGTATVKVSKFMPARVRAPDLRGGFACLLAALAAEGESRIEEGEILLRGYESLVSKLASIGADVKIIL